MRAEAAEYEIIASCLFNENCYIEATDSLTEKDFGHPYREMFKAIKDHTGDFDNLPVDVEAKLKHAGTPVDDFWHYSEGTKSSITEQIEVVKDMSLRRALFNLSGELMNHVKEEPDVKDFAVKTSQQLADLLNGQAKRKEQGMGDVMKDSLELIEKIRAGDSLGMKTGLDIDQITQGFQKGQFYILAARPSMGKTAMAVQVAQHIAIENSVAFLSLETTNKSLGMRYLANHARVKGDRIREGNLTDAELEALRQSAEHLSGMSIVMDDTTDISAQGLHTKVNYLKRKYDVDFLIVDYVQLMKSDRDNREQQVAEISRACVSVAKEFDICVLGLAQLNRGVESRGGDKRPMLSDLRESGQLEQDAFCVMLLHRPEYYGIKMYPEGGSTEGIAEVIIAKHKDGKTGVKKMLFEKETMRFENLMPY